MGGGIYRYVITINGEKRPMIWKRTNRYMEVWMEKRRGRNDIITV